MTAAAASPSLLRHVPFLFFLCSRGLSRIATQIAAVAVGWQIYEMTNSAFDLGMIGLVQFLPIALLVFVAGHAADRYDRRRVLQVCQAIECVVALFLAWGTYAGWITVPQIFVAMAVLGTVTAFENPATAALLPNAAPDHMLQQATAVSTAATQLAIIGGPAIGGIAYAVSPFVPFAIMAALWLSSVVVSGMIKVERKIVSKEPPTFRALFAGARFVRNNPAILGTISLDLFAVLLGGTVALLPIYARDILDIGPLGLGLLRTAPAIGSLAMTVALARHGITHSAGLRMFQAVIVFGLATMVFAVSKVVWLSLIALTVLGAADTVSVVVRFSLVQLATPDDMRGRVGAVNFLFINASNQLGQFQIGMTATLLGTVPAAVVGGVGTVLIAFLWMRLFPSLLKVERLG